MKKTKRYLFLFVLILLLAVPTMVVFAKELGKLTITGPGINGELTVSDPNFSLEQSGFFDQAALIKPPDNLNLDAGYSITAHLNLDGTIVPFAQMVYYPTNEGQPGYVHYTGRLNGDTLQTVDEWSVLSLSADDAFRDLMTANSVKLQSALLVAPAAAAPVVQPANDTAAQPVTAPVPSPAPMQSTYIALALGAAVILLLGAGLLIRRRTVSHTTT